MVLMINRRKSLILHKKRKMREYYQNTLDAMNRSNPEAIYQSQLKDLDNQDLINIVKNAQKMSKIDKLISGVTTDLSNGAKDRQNDEIEKSNIFWNTNKKIETEVDQLLKRLKYYDQEVTISLPHTSVEHLAPPISRSSWYGYLVARAPANRDR